MVYNLSNSKISISVDTHGAELKSLKKAGSDKEYMWDANPDYWKRTSPVLFPIVGSLNKGRYIYEGKEYPMSQHGFARDMEFELSQSTDSELKFVLKSNNETLSKYPFNFELEIGYRLEDNNVIVSWKVYNKGEKEMHFSIGGHPAFMCPINENEVQTDYKIKFDNEADTLIASVIGKGGTLSSRKKAYSLDNGYMNITKHLFDDDALIIEENQAHKVSLCTPDGMPYLTVTFDSPLFGVWSPVGKNAPFVCIEPWYGRCDKGIFEGDLTQREYGNKLQPDESFATDYSITI
jgi:galactose mutarotase-like enzyme